MFAPSNPPSSFTTEPPLVDPMVEHVAASKDGSSRGDDDLKSIFDDIPMQTFDSVISQCSLLDLENLPPSPTCVRHFPTQTNVFVTPSGLPLDVKEDTDDDLCIEELEMSSFFHVTATAMIKGKHPVVFRKSAKSSLYDTGANVTITKHKNEFVELEPTKPFSVGLATTVEGGPKPSQCAQCGFLPIPMVNGDIHYQRAYYKADASDTIISPQAICNNSGGMFTKWTQMGTTRFADDTVDGCMLFYGRNDNAIIKLPLR